jgi:competence/damage-inducible protein CinA-like protein
MAFVAVGSELLRAERIDTNSFLAARLLGPCGIVPVEKRVVEDDEEAIAAAIRELTARVEVVLVSGGLGPTADDVTRQGVARALGRGIARDAGIEAWLERRYRSFGREMPAFAARMADVVEGAEVLRNPHGTAPGQLLSGDGWTVVLAPGVPSELEEIVRAHLVPRWAASGSRAMRVLHLGGVYESGVEERVEHLYERFGREAVTILAGRGLVDLVLVADGREPAARLAEMESAFVAAAGTDLFGRDEETLAGVVVDRLRAAGLRLATGESCTGGMIGARITVVPGASDVYVGGVVAYADDVKECLLDVDASLIATRGAVSREVAEAMARGALRLGAEVGVGVTGIAGPGGGSADKPVGTVHLAVAAPDGIVHRHVRFPGHREMVRELAANFALDLVRRVLAGVA